VEKGDQLVPFFLAWWCLKIQQLKGGEAVVLKILGVSFFVLWPKLFFSKIYFLEPATQFRIFSIQKIFLGQHTQKTFFPFFSF